MFSITTGRSAHHPGNSEEPGSSGTVDSSPRAVRPVRRWRHKVRISIAGALAICLPMAVSACSTTGGSSGSSTSSSLSLTYVNPLPPYQGFSQTGACFKSEAEKFGYTAKLVGTPGNAVDNQAALNLIRQAIAGGSKGIFAFLTIPDLFKPVITQARDKGIYFGGMATGDPSTGQQFESGTDWIEGGKVLADAVGKAYPDARVGFLSSSPSASAQANAVAGFKQEAKAKYPGMKMVAIAYDNGDPTKDASLVSNMLAAHPEINMLNLVPGNTAGGIEAVKERGLIGKVKIVSGDLTPDHVAAMKAGQLWGVTVQDWCGMGKNAVDAFHDLASGKKISFTWPTSVTFASAADLKQ